MTNSYDTHSFTSIRMTYRSLTHNILFATKFYSKKIYPQDLAILNPKMFSYTSKFKRSILKLHLDGLITSYDDNSWQITNKGISYLYYIAKKTPVHTDSI
jgi:hypothetical protein